MSGCGTMGPAPLLELGPGVLVTVCLRYRLRALLAVPAAAPSSP